MAAENAMKLSEGLFGWARPSARGREPPRVEVVVREHADDVKRIVGHIVGTRCAPDEIDDVVQEVFIALDRALPRYRHDSRLTTFVYGVCVKTVLAHLRRRDRYTRMKERFSKAFVGPPDPPTPGEVVERRQAAEILQRALERLHPKHRTVWVLYEIEDMSASEVAEVIGSTEAAVRSNLRRARRDLDLALEELGV